MSDDHSSDGSEGPAIANNNTVDAVVSAILFMIGLVVVIEARRLGATWQEDGPGSGYFPFYIGLIVCFSAIGIFYQAMFSKSRNTEGFVNRVQLERVLSVLVPSLVYVLAIMYIGIYVASAIFIGLFMIFLGKYSIP
ncbi:MAG: tripartite tricarboxylate transporter TctB family protein, partial [Rubrivivax sp.]|nr:tripartite tricarboxylate transporter TctB family protein [Rubrivivax sp.]